MVRNGLAVLLLAIRLLLVANPGTTVSAQSGTDETPEGRPGERQKSSSNSPVISGVIRYSNNQIACSFAVEHEGLPLAEDIEALW